MSPCPAVKAWAVPCGRAGRGFSWHGGVRGGVAGWERGRLLCTRAFCWGRRRREPQGRAAGDLGKEKIKKNQLKLLNIEATSSSPCGWGPAVSTHLGGTFGILWSCLCFLSPCEMQMPGKAQMEILKGLAVFFQNRSTVQSTDFKREPPSSSRVFPALALVGPLLPKQGPSPLPCNRAGPAERLP